jgi:hypothetical protein
LDDRQSGTQLIWREDGKVVHRMENSLPIYRNRKQSSVFGLWMISSFNPGGANGL